MKFNCSFCKNPISSKSKICEWCGADDPLPNDISKSLQENSELYSRSEKKIEAFLISVQNINSTYKTSANQGVFGKFFNRIDKSNLEKEKVQLIDNFNVDLTDHQIIRLFDLILHEYRLYQKKKNSVSNIFNPSSSKELISDEIMYHWNILIDKYINKLPEEYVEKDIMEIHKKVFLN